MDLAKIVSAARLPFIALLAIGLTNNFLLYLSLASLDFQSPNVALAWTINPHYLLASAMGFLAFGVMVFGGYRIAKRTNTGALEGGAGMAIIEAILAIIVQVLGTPLLMPLFIKLYSAIPSMEQMANPQTIMAMQIGGAIFAVATAFALGAIGGFIGRAK